MPLPGARRRRGEGGYVPSPSTTVPWVRLKGADGDLFISAVYAPVYAAQKVAVFEEVMASYQTFRGKGLVAIGGDFNARCGYNGDVVISAGGKRLLDMCREAGLTVVNSMVDICQGDFTRRLREWSKHYVQVHDRLRSGPGGAGG